MNVNALQKAVNDPLGPASVRLREMAKAQDDARAFLARIDKDGAR